MRLRITAMAAAAVAALALPATSSAKSSSVIASGRLLHASGYTLLAFSKGGAATAVPIRASGRFRLRAGRDYTLQLLQPGGRYFGPIVLAHKGSRAYEAMSGRGAVNLGSIRLLAGYAAPLRAPSSRLIDARVWAKANRAGKPVGAGNLGLLRKPGGAGHITSRFSALLAAVGPCEPGGSGGPGCPGGQQPPAAGSPGAQQPPAAGTTGGEAGAIENGSGALPPGGDPTHVGIVTAFNADPTGAGVPADENPQGAAATGNGMFTQIEMPLEETANADAAGVTAEQISNLVKNDLQLSFYLQPLAPGQTVSSVTVDCGALVYCAEGSGTTRVREGAEPLWTGSIPASTQQPNVFQANLAPHASTSQIHPGDVFLIDYHTSSGTVTVPTTLTTYFVTVPAVASYDAGSGAQALAYPVAAGAPGTLANPIRMSSGEITVSLFRPQRAALPGEPGELVDVGRLHYGVAVRPPGGQPVGCASQYYTGLSPSLQVEEDTQDPTGKVLPLRDTTEDGPPNAASQISFTLNLAGCLAADGISGHPAIKLPITAADEPRDGGADTTTQNVYVCLPGCNPAETGELQGPGSS
jgi:hypothetical protein